MSALAAARTARDNKFPPIFTISERFSSNMSMPISNANRRRRSPDFDPASSAPSASASGDGASETSSASVIRPSPS